jgi:hypothetical protein
MNPVQGPGGPGKMEVIGEYAKLAAKLAMSGIANQGMMLGRAVKQLGSDAAQAISDVYNRIMHPDKGTIAQMDNAQEAMRNDQPASGVEDNTHDLQQKEEELATTQVQHPNSKDEYGIRRDIVQMDKAQEAMRNDQPASGVEDNTLYLQQKKEELATAQAQHPYSKAEYGIRRDIVQTRLNELQQRFDEASKITGGSRGALSDYDKGTLSDILKNARFVLEEADIKSNSLNNIDACDDLEILDKNLVIYLSLFTTTAPQPQAPPAPPVHASPSPPPLDEQEQHLLSPKTQLEPSLANAKEEEELDTLNKIHAKLDGIKEKHESNGLILQQEASNQRKAKIFPTKPLQELQARQNAIQEKCNHLNSIYSYFDTWTPDQQNKFNETLETLNHEVQQLGRDIQQALQEGQSQRRPPPNPPS